MVLAASVLVLPVLGYLKLRLAAQLRSRAEARPTWSAAVTPRSFLLPWFTTARAGS